MRRATPPTNLSQGVKSKAHVGNLNGQIPVKYRGQNGQILVKYRGQNGQIDRTGPRQPPYRSRHSRTGAVGPPAPPAPATLSDFRVKLGSVTQPPIVESSLSCYIFFFFPTMSSSGLQDDRVDNGTGQMCVRSFNTAGEISIVLSVPIKETKAPNVKFDCKNL